MGSAPARPGWSAWPAPAKLNLFLHVVGRRADGYHLLQTAFQLLDWGDTVHLRPREDGQIRRVDPLPGVAAEHDLAVRAAHVLQQAAGSPQGADIAIDKRIPLGGGLGADIPVFVRGHSAWAEGVGDQLVPLALPPRWYVVVDPGASVPTADLFRTPELTRDAPRLTIPLFLSGATTTNVFEPIVRERFPAVAHALDWLATHGAARLSGSGGCVFVAMETREAGEAVVRDCPEGLRAILALGEAVSPLHERLNRFGARHRHRLERH
jgi:4-diphosphocytidyl-2-C-methyl-D-erythritol kinase